MKPEAHHVFSVWVVVHYTLFRNACKTTLCCSVSSSLVITPFLIEKFSLKFGKENLSSTSAPNRGSNFSVTSIEPFAPLAPVEVPRRKIGLLIKNLRSTLDNQSIKFLKYAEGLPLCSLTPMMTPSAWTISSFSSTKDSLYPSSLSKSSLKIGNST